MEDFKSVFKYDLSENDKIQIDSFFKNSFVSPEQHYNWITITSGKTVCYFLAYSKNELVSYAVISESNKIASIFLGPIVTSTECLFKSVKSIKDHYYQSFGLLTIQLPNETSQEKSSIEFELEKSISYYQNNDIEDWASIKIDLSISEEELWKNIKSNHKGSINKANKMEVQTKELTTEEEIKCLALLFDEMYVNRGLPKMFNDTFNVFKGILNGNNIKTIILGVFTPDNVLIGGVICPIIGDTIHYKYGVSDFNYRQYPALHIALYSIILKAKAENLRWFDLGGYNHHVKEDDQVFKINLFKRSFGGQFVYYPSKMYIKLNPFKYLYINLLRKVYFLYLKLKN